MTQVRTMKCCDWADKLGTFMNIDPDSTAYFCRTVNWDLSDLDRKCRDYFQKYVNQGITDLIYDVANLVPTKTRDWYGERFTRTEENGQPVDYSEHVIAKAVYKLCIENNYDPLPVWFSLAKENGMRHWLSFRMNDVHYANEPLKHNRFYYTAKENGWMIGDTSPEAFWYGYALDYAVEEVREEMLSYIRDVLEVYDGFGIELDFSRTIRCFKELGHHNIPYMTDFLRKLRKICDTAAEKWGHPYRIMIRLSTRVAWAMDYGFDVANIVKEGLVDVLVPTAYWGSTDSAIPIDEWKAACGERQIPILYGMESNTVNFWHGIEPECLSGYALTAFARGADAVYLYNAFGAPWSWKIASSPAEALKTPVRRYLTTMNNFRPKGYSEIEAIYLPVTCTCATAAELSVSVGTLKAEEDTLICIGVKSEEGKNADAAAAALTVSLNGTPCEPMGRTGMSYIEKYYAKVYEEAEQHRYPWRMFTYRVPAGTDLTGDTAVLRFTASEAVSIHYAELINGKIG